MINIGMNAIFFGYKSDIYFHFCFFLIKLQNIPSISLSFHKFLSFFFFSFLFFLMSSDPNRRRGHVRPTPPSDDEEFIRRQLLRLLEELSPEGTPPEEENQDPMWLPAVPPFPEYEEEVLQDDNEDEYDDDDDELPEELQPPAFDFDPLGSEPQQPPLVFHPPQEEPEFPDDSSSSSSQSSSQSLPARGETFFRGRMRWLAKRVMVTENNPHVSEGQIDVFTKMAAIAEDMTRRFFDRCHLQNTSRVIESLTVGNANAKAGFSVGVGGLTYIFCTALYLIWKHLKQSRTDVLTRDNITVTWTLTTNDARGENASNTRIQLQIPRSVFSATATDSRNGIIALMRRLFGYIHTKISKAFGAQHDIWYHSSDRLIVPQIWTLLKLQVSGFNDRHMFRERGAVVGRFYPHRVAGPNYFWDLVFVSGSNAEFNQKCFENAIMMPSKDLHGRAQHGCFVRAMRCVCPMSDKFCRCNDGTSFDDIEIRDVPKLVDGNPLIVIVINVYDRFHKAPKDFQVLYFNPAYYRTPAARVIIINNPNWRCGVAHCCLMRVPPQRQEESEFDHFKRYSFFNELLHHLTRSKDSVCPMCGLLYSSRDERSHFKHHTHSLICNECGLIFKTPEELDVHHEYHCRHLGVGCEYKFAEEIKAYTEKPVKERAVVYADLESAINVIGEHINILCGWVERSENKVYIKTSIAPLFDYLKKLPQDEVLVYFHNGEGYDFHFVMQELAKIPSMDPKKFDIIADSSEKIRYFTINIGGKKKLIFKDTFAFVSQSLSSWLESTKKTNCSFSRFSNAFPNRLQREFVLQKNPFPYNAIQKPEDLQRGITALDLWFTAENRVELFCDKYTEEELRKIYIEWFVPAKEAFAWQTIEDYYKTYLKCDVTQLCDCMEHFVENVEEEFHLNAHDYYGVPSLTWAAWLRDVEFPLDPIPEEAFDIVNSSIRGGQTGAMTRYYNSEEGQMDEGSFLCDLDCNSLYATVMMKFSFPCSEWHVIHYRQELRRADVLQEIKAQHAGGYSGFIECDFNVIDDRRIHSYVPVASKRKLVGVYNYQAMAEMANAVGENLNQYAFVGLCNVVGEHHHYCCHSRLLEFYLEHEFIELKRVYRAVYGREYDVFNRYVTKNLEERKKYADDPIKKMLYKLMNNALYGKTYEDVTQRSDIKIISSHEFSELEPHEVKREIMKLSDWVIYEAPKKEFLIDKPIYLGAAITEYSKLWMYKFFYEDIRPRFPATEVYYTDTDALTIKFSHETGVHSLYDLAIALNTPERAVIDTSNWPSEMKLSPVHTKHNNEPGLFKSETGYSRIVKMIALRAKTYIMVCENGEIKMSVKGCPMKEKSRLTFDDFKDVLFGKKNKQLIEYDAITSKFHLVKTTQLTRVVLSADDRKRYISDDRIHTFPLFSIKHRAALGRVSLFQEAQHGEDE